MRRKRCFRGKKKLYSKSWNHALFLIQGGLKGVYRSASIARESVIPAPRVVSARPQPQMGCWDCVDVR